MKKEKRTFGKIMMALILIFFYLPIIYMIVFSFNEGKSLTAFTGFSLRWYQHMLESRDMMEALYTTFGVALAATFVSTIVGTIAAIGLSKSKKIVRDVMDQINNFPLMNPEIVTAIGHKFTSYIPDNNATCLEDGTKTAKCDNCSVTNTLPEAGSKLGHNIGGWVVSTEVTCTTNGEKKCE